VHEQRSHCRTFNQLILVLSSECVEQYYRVLHRVCESTEELRQELRQVKNERDQMSEDLINAENAFTDIKKRNEKLKFIINEHKTVGWKGKMMHDQSVCFFFKHQSRILKHSSVSLKNLYVTRKNKNRNMQF
jgi:galactokinase